MKLEYLREFLALAQELNYTVAARKLFISQSTLTRHMQALEHELGFSLLDATSHGVALTNYGKSAVPVFRKMVKEYDGFLSRTLRLSNQVSGKLTIGLLYYFMDSRFSGFLDHMRRRYPAVQIVTYAYQPQPLYDDLMSGKLDAGSLCFYQGRLPETLRCQVIGSAGTVAIVKRDHPLAERDGVSLEELRAYPLIELANDEFSNRLVADMLEANDITFENQIYTDNIETVPPVVRATGGVHITGEDCKKQHAEGIVYVPVTGRNTRYSIGLATVGHGNVLAGLLMDEAQLYFQMEYRMTGNEI